MAAGGQGKKFRDHMLNSKGETFLQQGTSHQTVPPVWDLAKAVEDGGGHRDRTGKGQDGGMGTEGEGR